MNWLALIAFLLTVANSVATHSPCPKKAEARVVRPAAQKVCKAAVPSKVTGKRTRCS